MNIDISIILRAYDIDFTTEHRFHEKRRWRFDFAIPEHKIAIEFEGGTWSGGRHTSGKGYAKDCEKYNAAQLLGWRVLRYTSDMVKRWPEDIARDVMALMKK